MKLLTALLLLVTIGYLTNNQYVDATMIRPSGDAPAYAAPWKYFKNSLELFAFEYRGSPERNKNGVLMHSYGKAFIAEGYILTAAHVASSKSRTTRDVSIVGKTNIFGLTLSTTIPKQGEWIYYRTKTGIIEMHVLAIDLLRGSLLVQCNEQVKNGQSGSPVLSRITHKVVGLVSTYYMPYSLSPGVEWAAEITLITRSYIKILEDMTDVTNKTIDEGSTLSPGKEENEIQEEEKEIKVLYHGKKEPIKTKSDNETRRETVLSSWRGYEDCERSCGQSLSRSR